MSEIDPRVLAKIKKCLALSGSSNPNEAATALRQAHALMDKHGVSTHEVTMADIGEFVTDSRTMARDKPARWETSLASIVGKAFGCQIIVSRNLRQKGFGHANTGKYVFIGLKQQAEVASYTATVLIRKCKSARQKWLADNLAGLGRGYVGGKAKMSRMGDMFAEGWVAEIGKLVAEFANPPEVDTAIKLLIEQRTNGEHAETRSVATQKIGAQERVAAMAGMRAAQGESLHRPMQTGETQMALENQF